MTAQSPKIIFFFFEGTVFFLRKQIRKEASKASHLIQEDRTTQAVDPAKHTASATNIGKRKRRQRTAELEHQRDRR